MTLSSEEAARLIGISPTTLPGWRLRGFGPSFLKVGRRVVYRRQTVEDWLADQERRSTSDPGPAGRRDDG